MSEHPPTKPVIEIETALYQLGGDPELLAETAQMFIDDGPDMVSAVRSAVSSMDAGEVERSAHRIKGSLATIAAQAAAEAAQQLEQMGRQGSLEGVQEAMRYLEQEMDRLLPELEKLARGGEPSTG